MNPAILSLALSIVVASQSGCSVDPSEGGGGFEGEALTLRGSVSHVGARLAGAQVSFLGMQGSAKLASTTTAADGGFSLRLSKGAKGFLEVRSGDTALSRTLIESIPTTSISVDAPTPVLWKAHLTNSGIPVANAYIRILGSSDSVRTAADGSFRLLRSATSAEWATLTLPDGTSRDLSLPSLSDTILPVPDHSAILLDDFEGPDTRSRLGLVVGSGWWFATTDTGVGGASTAIPSGMLSDFRAAYTTVDAWDKTSLSVQFIVDNSRQIHFCQVGMVLSENGTWMDFSALDSITFMAKGFGTTRLELATRTSVDPTYDPAGIWGVDIGIPAVWTRMVVRKADITAPAGSRPLLQNIPWSTDSKQVRNLTFFFAGSGSIQLDSIVLHGPKLADLLPRP